MRNIFNVSCVPVKFIQNRHGIFSQMSMRLGMSNCRLNFIDISAGMSIEKLILAP